MNDYRRRHDDPQSVWDYAVMLGRQCLFYLGAFSVAIVVSFGAGYYVGKTTPKEPSVTTQDCGSKFCKDKGETK